MTLSAGTTQTLTLTLNATGQALLAKFGKLTAIVTVSSGGKTIDTATVTVKRPQSRKRKRSRNYLRPAADDFSSQPSRLQRSNRDIRRSLSVRPSVWQAGQ